MIVRRLSYQYRTVPPREAVDIIGEWNAYRSKRPVTKNSWLRTATDNVFVVWKDAQWLLPDNLNCKQIIEVRLQVTKIINLNSEFSIELYIFKYFKIRLSLLSLM